MQFSCQIEFSAGCKEWDRAQTLISERKVPLEALIIDEALKLISVKCRSVGKMLGSMLNNPSSFLRSCDRKFPARFLGLIHWQS